MSFEWQFYLFGQTCQNLFFDYQHIYGEYRWGNPEVLRTAISLFKHSEIKSLEKAY
jgi:hypothetical protein